MSKRNTHARPFERLSYSQISQFKKCPLSYRYRYIEKLPLKPSPSLYVGFSIHEALHRFYSIRNSEFPSFQNLLDILFSEDCWKRDCYTSAFEEEQWKAKAIKAVKNFYDRTDISFHVPESTESWFEIPFKDFGFELIGKIDRIDKREGKLHIIDYKTNSKAQKEEFVKDDLQLALYHFACSEGKIEKLDFQDAPESVSLFYLLPNEIISFSLTNQDVEKAKTDVIETYENIKYAYEKNTFDPTVNNLCSFCDYLEICPERSRIESTKGLNFEDGFAELLKNFVAAHRNLEANISKINSLESSLIAELDKRGQKFIEYDGYVIELKEGTKYNLDQAWLHSFFKENGLYEAVTSLDVKKIIALLESPNLSDTAKSELRKRITKGEVKKVVRIKPQFLNNA